MHKNKFLNNRKVNNNLLSRYNVLAILIISNQMVKITLKLLGYLITR